MTGVTWTHVPYKGAPAALTDLASGQVQVMFSSLPAAMAFIRINRVKPIAVSSRTRADSLPQIPTVIESGFPGYEVEYWYGIFAPAATPRDALTKLGDEIAASLKLPDMVTNLANQGAAPGPAHAGAVRRVRESRSCEMGGVVKSSGAKAD